MLDPSEADMIQARSFRRCGGTVASVMNTPPAEAVSLGGWAGVPELASYMPDGHEVVVAWKRSMPHRYSDRKLEEEERQKLLHLQMLKLAVDAVPERKRGVAWSDIESVVDTRTETGHRALDDIKVRARDLVSTMIRPGTKPLYLAKTVIRRQFSVTATNTGNGRLAPRPAVTMQALLDGRKRKKNPEAHLASNSTPKKHRTSMARENSSPEPESRAEVLQCTPPTRNLELLLELHVPDPKAREDPGVWFATYSSTYVHRAVVETSEDGSTTYKKSCKSKQKSCTRYRERQVRWRGNFEHIEETGCWACPHHLCSP
jgi:hypothetical protein